MKLRTILPAVAFLVLTISTGNALAGSKVSVSVSPMMITNQGDEAIFTLTVSPPATRELRVKIFLSGTARPGAYELFGNFNSIGQVVIPAGDSQSFVTLRALGINDDPHPSSKV